MAIYQFEVPDEVRMRTFDTDNEAINYAEKIGWDTVTIMKQVFWEDDLATGFYWLVIFK